MTSPTDHFLDRLAGVVARNPEAVAVLERGEVALTYGQLWEQSSRLGAALQGQGIGREAIVGLAVAKSAGWLVGALGAWWAGAAYLPIDPVSPLDRLATIVGQARLAAVVAGPELAGFVAGLDVPVVAVDRLDGQPLDIPARSEPDDLAYVIFTSGSTGRPKGVMVTHRGIVPLVDAQIPAFGLRAGCRVLWLLSPVFDASLSDVGTALLSGSTLCIEDPASLASVDRLLDILDRRRITHLDLPPSLLRMLDPSAIPATVETLIIGGEPSPPEVVRRFAARFRVVNVYGPTEATVCSSLCLCRADAWDQPLLGEPIAGVVYQVLNDRLEPVAPGKPGELHIAGPCLARGYLNEPELTASKFVERDGVRLYRTGDRVLVRADGGFVFLGRVDRQVKLHGILVEPEEVEARLLAHPDVAQAAVVKRSVADFRADREGLVGFVVGRSRSHQPSVADLRTWLARSLPTGMIPRRLVFLAELPRLETGKVDLAALISRPLDPIAATSDLPAEGETAEMVAGLWKKVLGLNSINLAQSFFDHGGDSLSLMQVVAEARIAGLFLAPEALVAAQGTIPEIAQRLEERSTGAMLASDLRVEVDRLVQGLNRIGPAFIRPGPPAEGPPESVLFTGASGHLGSRLLGELLLRTDARFHVLVRESDRQRGLDRILTALRDHALESVDRDRIQVVLGDVGKPRLGLSPGDWDFLIRDVDTIFHNAAMVNMVAPFEALQGVNVRGTQEIVRFQAGGRRKRLHYASTLSVFVATDRNRGRLFESDELDQTRWVHGGYAQTKWAAEVLVRMAGKVEGPTSLYRLGLITGDSMTGRAAPGDFLGLFVRGLIRLGSVPRLERTDLRLDVTPVDFAARAMTHLALQPGPNRTEPATFHLANPVGLSLREMLDVLSEAGFPLEEVPADRWRSTIESAGPLDPEAAAAVLALCRALPASDGSFTAFRTMDLFQATDVEFDRSNARAGLAGSAIDWPLPGRELFRRYLSVPGAWS